MSNNKGFLRPLCPTHYQGMISGADKALTSSRCHFQHGIFVSLLEWLAKDI